MFNLKNVAMTAAGLCLAATASIASAVPIKGTLGYTGGSDLIYTGSDDTYANVTGIDFIDGSAEVETGTGAFSGLVGLDVSTPADITLAPFSVTPDATTPMWSVGGFHFYLQKITGVAFNDFRPNFFAVSGEGIVVSDNADYDQTTFSWDFSAQTGSTFSVGASPVPEASTLALLGLGLVGLGLSRKRKAA